MAAASAATLGRLSKIIADHADRHAHPREIEAVGPRPARHLLAERIGEGGDLLDRGGDRLEPVFIEPEPVDQPRRRRDVARIGVEDLARPRAKLRGDGADRRAPRLAPARGAAMAAAARAFLPISSIIAPASRDRRGG